MIKYVLFFLFASIVVTSAWAQIIITGQITDQSNNSPLVGASIQQSGTVNGTTSDANGRYSLTVNSLNGFLTVSFVGFDTQTIEIKTQVINVALVPNLKQLQEVVIVGSRNINRTELNTPVPVDVIDLKNIQKSVPQFDLNQLLTYAAPSFNSNRQSASDGSEHIDPASLRGLGPDQTLVLINGKRRHTTSLLNNQGTFGNGTVGTDLNAIPASAIERIEVLRDGASAQYGSDAIAGVINIVLKKSVRTFNANYNTGVTSRNDGQLQQFNANYGFPLGTNGGYINLTGDFYVRQKTNRTNNHNLIIFDQSANGDYFAYAFANDSAQSRAFDDAELANRKLSRDNFNFRIGDAKIQNASFFANFALPFGVDKRGEFYGVVGVSYRDGEGNGFRRLPSDYPNVVPTIFPNGFQPNTTSSIWDRSISVGARYKFSNDWKFDFSNTYGNNSFDYGVTNTVNASLQAASPTKFKAGGHAFTQNTINADLSKYFSAIASGLNLAFGSEFRIDSYQISEGEEASWKNYSLITDNNGNVTNPSGLAGGSQSFPGFNPYNEINKSRTNLSFYVDADLNVTKAWSVEVAARQENYSDFGSTINGKFATRLALTEAIALRGAISTGFRAPSLHQQYFSYVSTDILPSGKLGQSGFFRNESDLAKALGIPKLKQETSFNYSFGFTISPSNNWKLSVDGYQIDVSNRIVLTGAFGQDPFGGVVPSIQNLLTPYGANTARFFTNAIDTKTTGLDVVSTYKLESGSGHFDFTLAANFNKTTVDSKLNIPPALKGQDSVYFSPAEKALIETGNPRAKGSFTVQYSIGKFSALARETYFGEVTRNGFPFGIVQKHEGKFVLDVSVGYDITKNFSLTIGANNLLDVFPDKQVYGNSYFGVFKYAPVQMGTTGAFYFARLNIKY
ncbi:MAG: TonB-dependent receptor [Flammeovirgaceae bacterium]